MNYPKIEEVEFADRVQLARWYRFLPSPGWNSIDKKYTQKFQDALEKESKILSRIVERFQELGGFSPEISKEIG